MNLTKQQIQQDLDNLPQPYKTADVDRIIRQYVKQKADVSALRPCILAEQQFHRIYYYVNLDQIKNVADRMAFIHENLLFSDWTLTPLWNMPRTTSETKILSYAAGVMYCSFQGFAGAMQTSCCP